MAEMSLGIVETRGYVGLIEASDAMVKAANVKVVKYEKVGGGRLAIAVAGDVGAVRVAVEAGVEAGKRSGDVWATRRRTRTGMATGPSARSRISPASSPHTLPSRKTSSAGAA